MAVSKDQYTPSQKRVHTLSGAAPPALIDRTSGDMLLLRMKSVMTYPTEAGVGQAAFDVLIRAGLPGAESPHRKDRYRWHAHQNWRSFGVTGSAVM
jgi:hypothetical protein